MRMGGIVAVADIGGDIVHDATDLSVSGETQGDLIARGAATWDRLAPGTSGDVLTSTGAGSLPTYQTPGGGGAWSVIDSEIAFTSNPSRTFTIEAEKLYAIWFRAEGTSVSAEGEMYIRINSLATSIYSYSFTSKNTSGTDTDYSLGSNVNGLRFGGTGRVAQLAQSQGIIYLDTHANDTQHNVIYWGQGQGRANGNPNTNGFNRFGGFVQSSATPTDFEVRVTAGGWSTDIVLYEISQT